MKGVVLDAQLQALMDALGDSPYVDLAALPLAQAIRMARPAIPAAPAPEGSEDHTLACDDGSRLRLRLYYPALPRQNLPVVLYLHGGGFVGGTLEMDDIRCARLAAQAQCIVASLEYRLAPEYPFPSAINDGYNAWAWLQQNMAGIGGDRERCGIYGSSAGGHIAVGVIGQARERGAAMPIVQLLANPALDPDMASASYREFHRGPFLTAARMAWYWRQYAGARYADDSLRQPLLGDPAGYPPTHVMTAQYDVLRDEGEAYARWLCKNGIRATTARYPGMIHGFITVLPDHPASVKAMGDSAAVLRAHFA